MISIKIDVMNFHWLEMEMEMEMEMVSPITLHDLICMDIKYVSSEEHATLTLTLI